jgi:hypothetical protein
MMANNDSFGELASKDFVVGDIVQWSKWNTEKNCFEPHYGVLLEIKNQLKSNRVVSISKVMPLNNSQIEIEFFTLSLEPVSLQRGPADD